MPGFSKLWIWVAGLLVVVGCGGGGGQKATPPSQPQAPVLLAKTEADPVDFDKMTLSWSYTAPALPDGYKLEYQIDGSGYQLLASDLIPPSVEALYLTFDPSTPECHTFGFRLSAMRGTTALAQSETSYRRSLRPVWNPSLDPRPECDAILATWQKDPSSIATGFLVERNEGLGGWVPVPSGVDGVDGVWPGCWDFSCLEGKEYTYRIYPTLGSERGMPRTAKVNMPMKAPDHLSASAAAPGFKVNWLNRSTTATDLKIYRATLASVEASWSDPVLVGTVPATATTFLDASPPSAARVAYQVAATRSNWPVASSAWCLTGGPSTLDGLGMSRANLTLPFVPLGRETDGGWLGIVPLWNAPRYAMRIEHIPAVPGYPMGIPLTFGSLDYPTISLSSRLGANGTLDLQLTEEVGSFGRLNSHVMRFAGGTWKSRSFHSDQGLSLLRGGFSPDGVLQCFTYNSSFQAGQLRMEADGSVTQGLVPDLPPGGKWGPFWTPSGVWIALTQDRNGWYLASRSLEGAWTFRPLTSLDPATHSDMDCRGVRVDSSGVLHALFANALTDGFQTMSVLIQID